MEDAVRPSEAVFRATYERGYRTWASLWKAAAADKYALQDYLTDLSSAIANHPYFPKSLALDKSFSNTAIARGRTTWGTTQGPCELSTFQEDVIIQVASNCVTPIVFVSNPDSATRLQRYVGSGSKNNHVTILTLAWAYVLSARWAELIPGARTPTYSHQQNNADKQDDDTPVEVKLGEVDKEAREWWTAILSTDNGWNISIQNDKGLRLYAPWSIKTLPKTTFRISANTLSRGEVASSRPASYKAALRYMSEYCSFHSAADECQAALAAALLIPMAKLENRKIELPVSRLPLEAPNLQERKPTTLAWNGDFCQFDRLLTLSCNAQAVRSLLSSVFFDPDVACNVCGAWLQGSFAFLDSDTAKDYYLRLRTFMNRDPGLGFLWLGAFITGFQARCLQEARSGWWKVHLSSAAWTGTQMSFIQEPTTKTCAVGSHISRADECRLMYLSHEQDHATPPLFPFAPFGLTALEDTDLSVRQHSQCSAIHGLKYDGFTWDCDGDGKVDQRINMQAPAFRHKQPTRSSSEQSVTYENMDSDDEVSEIVTRNIFTWLRGDDGFPVAERAIREHEWINNLESDDDSPVEGDVRSTFDRSLSRWFLGLSNTRSL